MRNASKYLFVVVPLALGAFILGGFGFVLTGDHFKGMSASVTPAVLNWFVNQERLQNQLAELEPNDLLAEAARLKAEDMATRAYFSHYSPEGWGPWYWFDVVGYDYDYAGENLALDFQYSREVSDAWMRSSTHRSNLLKTDYTQVGTGVATGTYLGREVQYVVQMYARPVYR